ncbi:MAG: hypothetical protein M3Y56_08880 [Armatimonadota bacterium]|nr:hypothetical protein [Armatimonadota bacterium]
MPIATTYANIPGMTFDPENHLTTVPGMMQAGYDGDDLRAWKGGASATYYLS